MGLSLGLSSRGFPECWCHARYEGLVSRSLFARIASDVYLARVADGSVDVIHGLRQQSVECRISGAENEDAVEKRWSRFGGRLHSAGGAGTTGGASGTGAGAAGPADPSRRLRASTVGTRPMPRSTYGIGCVVLTANGVSSGILRNSRWYGSRWTLDDQGATGNARTSYATEFAALPGA